MEHLQFNFWPRKNYLPNNPYKFHSPGFSSRLIYRYKSPKGKHDQRGEFVLEKLSYNMIHVKHYSDRCPWQLGQEIRLEILAYNGQWSKINASLAHINQESQLLGLKLLSCSGQFKEFIGRRAFDNLNISSKQLYKLQFPVSSVKNSVEFKAITIDDDDYQQVISLRQKAYAAAGKLCSEQKCVKDEFEYRSIILIAKHHQLVVASLRLIISTNDQMFEHEKCLVLPKTFPEKKNTIEITRVCTHPDYRHSDLLEGLFQFTSFMAFTNERQWIIGSSTLELLPLYQKIGFKISDIKFQHSDLGHTVHKLFIANKNDIIKGLWVHPLAWSSLYRDIYWYAKQRRILPRLNWRDKTRIALYTLLGFAGSLYKAERKRRWLTRFAISRSNSDR